MDSDEDLVEEMDTSAKATKAEALRQFIETYESLPVLWNSSNEAYRNKAKKNAALDQLLQVFKALKPDAVRADVSKKINSLRTNFRKELKKIVSSKRSGAGTEDVYRPQSWIFDSLKFLQKIEQPVSSGVTCTSAVSIFRTHQLPSVFIIMYYVLWFLIYSGVYKQNPRTSCSYYTIRSRGTCPWTFKIIDWRHDTT